MNKLATLVLATLLSGSVYANNGGFTAGTATQVGFTGPKAEITSVETTKKLRDDSHVILRGKIERHLGGEHYIFHDETGSINVDIDDRLWNGQEVTPDDLIEIQGEVDKDWNSIEVDVDKVIKLK